MIPTRFPQFRRGIALVAAVLLTSLVTPAHAARRPSEGTVLFGAATEGSTHTLSRLDDFEEEAGKRVGLYSYYQSFRLDADFDADGATAVRCRNAIPMLTWEPWDPRVGRHKAQPRYAPRRIAAGDHDAYIERWARQIAAWGEPIWLRFAHEMNGNWYPWGLTVRGNTPADYRAAWRRVHDIFRRAGAGNVRWVWSPNIEHGHAFPLDGLYPGDDVVDLLAVDGYNWGTNRGHRWKHPDEVFNPTLARLRGIARKPIVIAETASAEQGGDKATWIRQFFTTLSRNPDIVAFVWFNLRAEEDWRITTSRAARRAFAAEVSAHRYR